MDTPEKIEESGVLDFAQRRKRGITLRRFAAKIKIARERAKLKKASNEKIIERARKAAIKIVRKIVAGKLGLDYNNAPVAQRMMIDSRVQQKAAIIPKITQRLIPKIRKLEAERLAARKNVHESEYYFHEESVPEEYGAGLEGTDQVVDKYKSETPGQENFDWRMVPTKRTLPQKMRRMDDDS